MRTRSTQSLKKERNKERNCTYTRRKQARNRSQRRSEVAILPIGEENPEEEEGDAEERDPSGGDFPTVPMLHCEEHAERERERELVGFQLSESNRIKLSRGKGKFLFHKKLIFGRLNKRRQEKKFSAIIFF